MERAVSGKNSDCRAHAAVLFEIAAKFSPDAFAFRGIREAVRVQFKNRLHRRAEFLEREIREAGDDAMRRQNCQTFAGGVEERHHREFVRRIAVLARGARAAFVAVGERGLVAMMAVGDDEALLGHLARDGRRASPRP